MKKIILALVATAIGSTGVAQPESLAHRTAAGKFETYYNMDAYDSVFAIFSPEMQKALPLDKVTEFLTGLKEQAGRINKREFARYEKKYAVYKTNFDNTLFAINLSVNENGKINGLFVKPFTENNLPRPERNTTKMLLPFNGEWTVIWGGDTKEQNYHVATESQKNAFDIVITDAKGNSYKTDGKTNEDYYAFGKELVAPCDGQVVLVVDGIKDNVPGVLNPIYVPGNTVIIKTANNEYLLFAHFKQRSIVVKEGQQVKQGQLLGLCGNSGNSSEAHLHFHIQNVEDMSIATGIKCYFEKIRVNGKEKTDYSPVQHEKISN